MTEQSDEYPAPGDIGFGRPDKAQTMIVGTGKAIAHHGELLQGVFEGADGRLHRALVTLPYPALMATATFWPHSRIEIDVRPPDRIKAARAASLTLNYLALPGGGDITIESTVTVGHGYGSSTVDVVASICATAAAAGVTLRRSTISRLAIEAETASDALAYADQPVLFAHREGMVLEHFGSEYPPLVVVGSRAGLEPVDTVTLARARYSAEEVEQFRTLRGMAAKAFDLQDPWLLGRMATQSARISQRHLPKSGFEAVLQLGEDCGACGIQVSHSGTVIGLLFDGQGRQVVGRSRNAAKLLSQGGFSEVRTFSINLERRVSDE